jgi:putative RNase toxin 21 of polymorphic toxin system
MADDNDLPGDAEALPPARAPLVVEDPPPITEEEADRVAASGAVEEGDPVSRIYEAVRALPANAATPAATQDGPGTNVPAESMLPGSLRPAPIESAEGDQVEHEQSPIEETQGGNGATATDWEVEQKDGYDLGSGPVQVATLDSPSATVRAAVVRGNPDELRTLLQVSNNTAERAILERALYRAELNGARVGEEATRNGYPNIAKDPPFDPKGQKVFTDGKNFLTRDADSHSGGVWKIFDRFGNRLGTYDQNLNRIGD